MHARFLPKCCSVSVSLVLFANFSTLISVASYESDASPLHAHSGFGFLLFDQVLGPQARSNPGSQLAPPGLRQGSCWLLKSPKLEALAQGWYAELQRCLADNPRAIVGEFGIDRAARVPGTRCVTDYKHQWDVFNMQMAAASQYGRPVRSPVDPMHACFLIGTLPIPRAFLL